MLWEIGGLEECRDASEDACTGSTSCAPCTIFSVRPPIPQAQPRPVQLNLDPVSIPACTATRVEVYLYFTFTMHLVAECGGHPSFSASRQQAYFFVVVSQNSTAWLLLSSHVLTCMQKILAQLGMLLISTSGSSWFEAPSNRQVSQLTKP